MSTDVIGPGAVNQSILFHLDTAGLTIADLKLGYIRWNEGDGTSFAEAVSVALTELATITTAHTDNYAKYLDTDITGANQFILRVDFPDAAFATGRDYVICNVYDDGNSVIAQRIFKLEVDYSKYPDGFVYLDSFASNTNTTPNIDGTRDNPVSTLAAAISLTSKINSAKIRFIGTPTWDQDTQYHTIEQLDMDSQIVGASGMNLSDCILNGVRITTGCLSNAQTVFNNCELDGITTAGLEMNGGKLNHCSLMNTIKLSTGNLLLNDCREGVAEPTLDFNASTADVVSNGFKGKLNIANLSNAAASLKYYADGANKLVLAASCTAGAATLFGEGAFTDSSAGTTVTIDDWANVSGNFEDTINEIIDVIESQRGSHTHQSQGLRLYVGPNTGDTAANGATGTKKKPFSTVTEALAQVTGSRHALIHLIADNDAGVTTLTEAVTISKRYTQIRGPGRDFIWTRAGAGDTITVTADGVGLSGFQLNTAAVGTGAGINATDCDFLRASNLWINDTQGDGIKLLRVDNANIKNNVFMLTGQGGAGQGIDISGLTGTSNNNTIENNLFFSVAGDAIKVANGTIDDTVIRNNDIYGSSGYAVNLGVNAVGTVVKYNSWGGNSSGDLNNGGTGTIQHGNIPNETLSGRIPAALVGGRMDSNMSAINNDATAAQKAAIAALASYSGTVGAGSHTTTTILASSITGYGDNHFVNKTLNIISPTAQAREGQGAVITGYTGSSGAFTLSSSYPLQTAPSNGDTILIS